MEQYITKFEGKHGVKWQQTSSELASSYRSFVLQQQQELDDPLNENKMVYCKTGVNPSFNVSMTNAGESSTWGITRGQSRAKTRPGQSRQRSETYKGHYDGSKHSMSNTGKLNNSVFEEIKNCADESLSQDEQDPTIEMPELEKAATYKSTGALGQVLKTKAR
jgi:hypothetical protein